MYHKTRELEKIMNNNLKIKSDNIDEFDEELAFSQQSIINNSNRFKQRDKCSDRYSLYTTEDEECMCQDEYDTDGCCMNHSYGSNNTNNCHSNKCHSNTCKPKEKECCCKKSMQEALFKVLRSLSRVDGLVQFDQFAFVGDKFLVGATYKTGAITQGDNIDIATTTGDSNAQFNSFDPCNLDVLNIQAGQLIPIYEGDTPITQNISKVSLCDINAIAFNLLLTTIQSNSLVSVQSLLKNCFDNTIYDCCEISSPDCCCNEGILKSLSSPGSFTSPSIGLTAGSLIVKDIKLLGVIGSVLVLYNKIDDTNGRIYLVCLDSVGFIF